MKNRTAFLLSSLAVFGVILIAGDTAFSQGRSGGAGRPASAGPPANTGRPSNPGIGTASQRSGGRSDTGLGTAAQRSGGRSTAGLDRASQAQQNQDRADRAVRENPGAAPMLNASNEELRAQYQEALESNPQLKFGQFIASRKLEQNLNSRFPNVTSGAILAGLADGDSIGHTLRNLGVSSGEARTSAREVTRAIKESKRRN